MLLNLISNGFCAATKRKAQANGGNYEPTLAAATKNLGDIIFGKDRNRRLRLRPHLVVIMFGTENVIVEVRDPLLPGSRRVEVSHRRAKMHRDAIPEKGWILVDQVSWRLVSSLPVNTDFLKLAIQRVCLSRIKGIA